MNQLPLEQTQAEELVIDNLETLKVIADQLRKRIMEHFDQPSTVKEVAKKLGTSPSKLYYHVNLLEEHGLLKVTDTRIVSGIIEKQYQAAARIFRVKVGLLSPTPEDGNSTMEAMLAQFFDQPKEEIRNGLRTGLIQTGDSAPKHLKLQMSMATLSITPAQAQRFYERLNEIAEEIQALDGKDNEDEQAYVIQFSMFPVAKAQFGDEDETDSK
jgi:AraC-like DNA-binding protein